MNFTNAKPSIIDNQTKITGTISAKQNLHIEGIVDGKIQSDQVLIDRKAICHGEITAKNVEISGHFDGDITANHVHVKADADVEGKIMQKTIAVDTGAVINAHIQNI